MAALLSGQSLMTANLCSEAQIGTPEAQSKTEASVLQRARLSEAVAKTG